MFSHLLGKKTKRTKGRSRILDRKGQGTVEYVLLLVITVGIILGLMNQFYKPFNEYLKNYMGAYVQCLLDVGELPALGWDSTEGVCNSEFEPLSAGGRPPIGANPRTPAKPNDENPKDPAARGNVVSSDAGSSSGRKSPGSRMLVGGTGSSGTDGSGDGQEKVQKIPVELEDTRYFRVGRAGPNETDGKSKRVRAVGIAGLIGSEKDKLAREQTRIKRLGAFEDMGAEGKPKKMRVKGPGDRKVASVEDDAPWTFGKFIRLALILFLIIAIILFLGGQALQISKGMDA